MTAAAVRGRLFDYCPTCGSMDGHACQTPTGRVRPDHVTRQPTCNGNWHERGCNLHAGPCEASDCTCGHTPCLRWQQLRNTCPGAFRGAE